MRTIMITGAAGVGKSTIAKQIAKKIGCGFGDYADFMLEAMNESSKDILQYLSWPERRRVYDQVELLLEKRFLYGKDDNLVYILENHLTIKQDGRIINFPTEDYKRYNMAALLVIEANPEIIIQRRMNDKKHRRFIENVNIINALQTINWQEAQNISYQLQIPCLRVNNFDSRKSTLKIFSWLKTNNIV